MKKLFYGLWRNCGGLPKILESKDFQYPSMGGLRVHSPGGAGMINHHENLSQWLVSSLIFKCAGWCSHAELQQLAALVFPPQPTPWVILFSTLSTDCNYQY